jgi:hypothetical protein
MKVSVAYVRHDENHFIQPFKKKVDADKFAIEKLMEYIHDWNEFDDDEQEIINGLKTCDELIKFINSYHGDLYYGHINCEVKEYDI